MILSKPGRLFLPFFLLVQVSGHSTVVAAENTSPAVTPETEAPVNELPLQATDEIIADETPDPETEARMQQALKDKAQYEALIAKLEFETDDAYNAELSETYMSLGNVLETLQDYEQAAAVFEKALQSVRTSNGLNSLQQLPILQELLASNEQLQKWDDVEANSTLIYHITRKNFPAGHQQRIQAIEQLANWKLKAALRDTSSSYNDDAMEAADLYDNEIRQLEGMEDNEERIFQMAALRLGEARSKLVIAQQVLQKPISDYRVGGNSSTTTQRCYYIRLRDGSISQVCEIVEVPNADYYLDPVVRRNMEIGKYLADIRHALTDAYEVLQTQEQPVQRDVLLSEVQSLTEAYNKFVTDNSL